MDTKDFVIVLLVALLLIVIILVRPKLFNKSPTADFDDCDDETLDKVAASWSRNLQMVTEHICSELGLMPVNELTEENFAVDTVAPNVHKALLTCDDYLITTTCNWPGNWIKISIFKRTIEGTPFQACKVFRLNNGGLPDAKIVKWLDRCAYKINYEALTKAEMEKTAIEHAAILAKGLTEEEVKQALIRGTLLIPPHQMNKRNMVEYKAEVYAYLLKFHKEELLAEINAMMNEEQTEEDSEQGLFILRYKQKCIDVKQFIYYNNNIRYKKEKLGMEQLTLQKELEVIKYLKGKMGSLFYGSGSSRAVFGMDNKLCEMLNYSAPYPSVIKMSLGLGGFRQSRLEQSTYEHYSYTKLFADIFARGSVLTLMEEVDTEYDFYGLYEDGSADYILEGWHSEEDIENETEAYLNDKRLLEDALDTMWTLGEYLGDTSDNAQIGMNHKGNLVAYDYGFTPDRYCDEQTTRTSDYFSYGKEETDQFFDLLIATLEEAIAQEREELEEEDFAVLENNYVDLIGE